MFASLCVVRAARRGASRRTDRERRPAFGILLFVLLSVIAGDHLSASQTAVVAAASNLTLPSSPTPASTIALPTSTEAAAVLIPTILPSQLTEDAIRNTALSSAAALTLTVYLPLTHDYALDLGVVQWQQYVQLVAGTDSQGRTFPAGFTAFANEMCPPDSCISGNASLGRIVIALAPAADFDLYEPQSLKVNIAPAIVPQQAAAVQLTVWILNSNVTFPAAGYAAGALIGAAALLTQLTLPTTLDVAGAALLAQAHCVNSGERVLFPNADYFVLPVPAPSMPMRGFALLGLLFASMAALLIAMRPLASPAPPTQQADQLTQQVANPEPATESPTHDPRPWRQLAGPYLAAQVFQLAFAGLSFAAGSMITSPMALVQVMGVAIAVQQIFGTTLLVRQLFFNRKRFAYVTFCSAATDVDTSTHVCGPLWTVANPVGAWVNIDPRESRVSHLYPKEMRGDVRYFLYVMIGHNIAMGGLYLCGGLFVYNPLQCFVQNALIAGGWIVSAAAVAWIGFFRSNFLNAATVLIRIFVAAGYGLISRNGEASPRALYAVVGVVTVIASMRLVYAWGFLSRATEASLARHHAEWQRRQAEEAMLEQAHLDFMYGTALDVEDDFHDDGGSASADGITVDHGGASSADGSAARKKVAAVTALTRRRQSTVFGLRPPPPRPKPFQRRQSNEPEPTAATTPAVGGSSYTAADDERRERDALRARLRTMVLPAADGDRTDDDGRSFASRDGGRDDVDDDNEPAFIRGASRIKPPGLGDPLPGGMTWLPQARPHVRTRDDSIAAVDVGKTVASQFVRRTTAAAPPLHPDTGAVVPSQCSL